MDRPDSPAAVIRAWFEGLWNEQREETIDQFLTADSVVHGVPGVGSTKGPDEFKAFYHSFREGFPDARIELLHVIEEGDRAAVHCKLRAVHSGDGMGMKATGQPTDVEGMAMAQVRDGKIVEGWNFYDFIRFYQQINVLPATFGLPPA